MAGAYADYAAAAQCCAGGVVVTADFAVRKAGLVAALLASSANPACGPFYALRVMANGFAAFWLAPTPAAFIGPGAVTVALPDVLYAAMVATFLPQVRFAAGGGRPDGAGVLAGVLDSWTRTIVATVPGLPCTGPLV